MESVRHVVLVGNTPLGALLAKRFDMTHFEREAVCVKLSTKPGHLGTFMHHNIEWKDRSPLVYEHLETLTSGSLVIDNILEDVADVDRLAAILGNSLVIVVAVHPNALCKLLRLGGFYHELAPTDNTEANFKSLVNMLGNDNNFGTFRNYGSNPDALWAGAWTNHPLEGIAQPVKPSRAASVVQLVLELAISRREWKQFCGTHPVSLDRENNDNLIKHPYAISPKVDGTRYFLLVTEGALFFINRACDVWAGPKNPALVHFNDSLLDCEITAEPGTTRNYPTLMIIDTIAMNGNCKRNLHLRRRIDACRALVKFLQSGKANFTVVFQRYLDLHRTDASVLLSNWNPSDPTNTIDGFVFTPLRMPYIMGRCYHLLKWKPNDKNTVDLSFEEPNKVYCLDEHEERLLVGEVSGVPRGTSTGAILECRGAGERRWVFDRERTDKTTPNVQWVLDRITKTISDNITVADILQWLSASRAYRQNRSVGQTKRRRSVPTNRYDALRS